MVVGIGTDLVEVERIRKAIEHHDRFLTRVFSENERRLFDARGNDVKSIAANFSGKEAVLKVFGTGIRGCSWLEIEILRETSGKPYVNLTGRAKLLAEGLGIDEILISLSHTATLATAYAVGLRR
jgi:holo-[acyl-carrier protein] synthase